MPVIRGVKTSGATLIRRHRAVGRFRGEASKVPGSRKRRAAELWRKMIAGRRRVGMLENDVPEYLVDNGLIGDERDDPHRGAGAVIEDTRRHDGSSEHCIWRLG